MREDGEAIDHIECIGFKLGGGILLDGGELAPGVRIFAQLDHPLYRISAPQVYRLEISQKESYDSPPTAPKVENVLAVSQRSNVSFTQFFEQLVCRKTLS